MIRAICIAASIVTLAVPSCCLLWGQDKEPLPEGSIACVVTSYCPAPCCCGDFPGKIRGQTASGNMAQPNRTLAAPRDIPFGTEVWVLADGQPDRLLGIVEDRGGAIRWRGAGAKRVLHLDKYIATHKAAREWGVQEMRVRLVVPTTKKED